MKTAKEWRDELNAKAGRSPNNLFCMAMPYDIASIQADALRWAAKECSQGYLSQNLPKILIEKADELDHSNEP